MHFHYYRSAGHPQDRKILRIAYTRHTTNTEVRAVSNMVMERRLRIVSHRHRAARNSLASIRLETTSRKTQLHVAQNHWIGSETAEHWSFLCVEESSLSRTPAWLWTWLHSRRVCYEDKKRNDNDWPVLPSLSNLENTGVQLWILLCSRRVRHEEKRDALQKHILHIMPNFVEVGKTVEEI